MNMHMDKSARCKYCGKSQRERFQECSGNRLHHFIRTQIRTYQSELQQIWISKHTQQE